MRAEVHVEKNKLFGCGDNSWLEAKVAGGNPVRKIIDMLETMQNKDPG